MPNIIVNPTNLKQDSQLLEGFSKDVGNIITKIEAIKIAVGSSVCMDSILQVQNTMNTLRDNLRKDQEKCDSFAKALGLISKDYSETEKNISENQNSLFGSIATVMGAGAAFSGLLDPQKKGPCGIYQPQNNEGGLGAIGAAVPLTNPYDYPNVMVDRLPLEEERQKEFSEALKKASEQAGNQEVHYIQYTEQGNTITKEDSAEIKLYENKLKNENKDMEDMLKDKNLFKEKKDTVYVDKNGNAVDEKNGKKPYSDKATLTEMKIGESNETSTYSSKIETEDGYVQIKINKVKVDETASTGSYIIGDEESSKLAGGVGYKEEVSYSVVEITNKTQRLGDENFGLYSGMDVDVGEASAGYDVHARIYGKDGSLNPDIKVSADMQANLVSVDATTGVNLLGGDVEVGGGVSIGVGAHGEVGYSDGVFSCEFGAAVGLGLDIKVNVDIGGMKETITESYTDAKNWVVDHLIWW